MSESMEKGWMDSYMACDWVCMIWDNSWFVASAAIFAYVGQFAWSYMDYIKQILKEMKKDLAVIPSALT